VERFVGSALDGQPWGTVHVVVALTIALVVSAMVVMLALAVSGRLRTELQVKRLSRDLDLLSVLPAGE
jgi:hypothetical protein